MADAADADGVRPASPMATDDVPPTGSAAESAEVERSDASSTKAALANDLFGSDDDDDLPIMSRSRAVVTDKDDEADGADRVKSDSDVDEADRAGKELSDLEDDDADREAPSRHDLFGSDDDDLDGDDAAKSKEPEEPAFLPPITLELPTLADPADAQLYSFKLPQSVSIEPRPYARGAFLEAHPDRRVKELVANTMRWRTATSPQGETAKESNARFVRWSDGSMTFHVGETVFDVADEAIHDAQFLFAAHADDPSTLESHGSFTRRMILRPSAGQELELIAGQARAEEARRAKGGEKTVKMVAITQDPSAMQRAQEQQELERIRAKRRLETLQRSHRERFRLDEMALEEGESEEEDEDDRRDKALLSAKRGTRKSRRLASDDDDDDDDDE